VTPALIEAAKKEGKIVWYTSLDLPAAEKVARAFEAKYSGVAVRVERTGAERVFQRIGQEYASASMRSTSSNRRMRRISSCGSATEFSSPMCPRTSPSSIRRSTRIRWHVRQLPGLAQRDGLQYRSGESRGRAQELRRSARSKWKGKMVKAHPGYSGTIMTSTFQMARDIGWDYFEKLAKQNVMQVQSSADPPKKLELGERSVMADGNEYNMFQLKEGGKPVEIVYPTEALRSSSAQRSPQGRPQSERRPPVPELIASRRRASNP